MEFYPKVTNLCALKSSSLSKTRVHLFRSWVYKKDRSNTRTFSFKKLQNKSKVSKINMYHSIAAGGSKGKPTFNRPFNVDWIYL